MTQREYTFTAVYEHDPETGYVCASIPALDLGTHGQALDEARAMMREAVALHLKGMLEEEMAIPSDVVEVEQIKLRA